MRGWRSKRGLPPTARKTRPIESEDRALTLPRMRDSGQRDPEAEETAEDLTWYYSLSVGPNGYNGGDVDIDWKLPVYCYDFGPARRLGVLNDRRYAATLRFTS